MSRNGNVIELELQVDTGNHTTTAAFDLLSQQLHAELSGSEVESIERLRNDTLRNTNAMPGTLLIKYRPTAADALLRVVKDWTKNEKGRKLRFKTRVAGNKLIEFTYSPEEGYEVDVDSVAKDTTTMVKSVPLLTDREATLAGFIRVGIRNPKCVRS